MEQPLWLIAGLGNPGLKYEKNWHNAGYMALDVLAARHQIAISRIKFKGLYGQGSIAGQRVILLKPTTYMNLSGESIQEAITFFKIPLERVLVLYDDLDIPAGEVRMRPSGGPGTHNGMRSIVERLSSVAFPRIRIGIGPLPNHWELVNYVLSDIPVNQQELVWQAQNKAADAVALTLAAGLEAAMNQVNRRDKPKPLPRAHSVSPPASPTGAEAASGRSSGREPAADTADESSGREPAAQTREVQDGQS